MERVVITRRVGGGGGTYYARIVLNLPGGAPEAPRLVSVDSRPSDSIALALQAGAALFVAKDLARWCLGEPGNASVGPQDATSGKPGVIASVRSSFLQVVFGARLWVLWLVAASEQASCWVRAGHQTLQSHSPGMAAGARAVSREPIAKRMRRCWQQLARGQGPDQGCGCAGWSRRRRRKKRTPRSWPSR